MTLKLFFKEHNKLGEGDHKLGEGKHDKLGEGTHNKLGEGERKVRLGQDSLPNSHFHSGN